VPSFNLDYLSLLAWKGRVVNNNLHGDIEKNRIDNLTLYNFCIYKVVYSASALKQSVGARNLTGIWLSYQPARLQRLAEVDPWNRFLGSSKGLQIRALG
jgi:hypothetical protein